MKIICSEQTLTFRYSALKCPMGEDGLADGTNILDSDVTDRDPAGGANIYYKARIFSLTIMLPVKVSIL